MSDGTNIIGKLISEKSAARIGQEKLMKPTSRCRSRLLKPSAYLGQVDGRKPNVIRSGNQL